VEIIALMGPYDQEIKALIHKSLPDGFTIKEISAESQFGDLHDVQYVILRTFSMKEHTINSMPMLRLIQRWGVGHDKVDIKAAGIRNIPVAITSGMNAPSVSEMALLLMLAVYRQLPRLYKNVVTGKWRGEAGIASTSYVIDGKVVGIIGFGAIGKQVAEKVKAFGAKAQYYDIVRQASSEEQKWDVQYAELKELLRTSDIVSLHLPLTGDTRHLIRKETIELMKPDAIIINTARGEVIKEDDLVEALKNKRIRGAGLDVMEHEPPDKNSPLFALENVVLTPHMAGSTMDINVSMVKRCIDNIVNTSKGKGIMKTDLVNAQYLHDPKIRT